MPQAGIDVLQYELNSQIEANGRLKAIVGNLTNTINQAINQRVDSQTLKKCQVSQALIDEIETELSPFELEETEDEEQLEARL